MLTEHQIRALFEKNGVQFVNRSYGLTSTQTITFDCLVKTVQQAIT